MLDNLVDGATFNVVGVVKIFDRDELLKSGPGEFCLFDEFSLSTHSVDSW